MTTHNDTTIPTTGKHVAHNPTSGRYDVYVNGHLLGDRSSEDAALAALYDLEQAGRLYTTAQLDEEITADRGGPHPAPVSPAFYGVSISPGVEGNRKGGTYLNSAPVLAIRDGVPTVRLGGCTDEELAEMMRTDPEPPTSLLPQQVHEIVRLTRRGLVILDAEHEVFVMAGAEFAEQTGDDNQEDNERAARLGELPIEDRVFAATITSMLDQVEHPYRAMAQAGMILLAAACDGVGPTLADDASAAETEEEISTRIYHAAYSQGFDEGHKAGFDEGADSIISYLKTRIQERDAARLTSEAPTPLQLAPPLAGALAVASETRTEDGSTWTEYRCGDVLIDVYAHTTHAPAVYLFGGDPVSADEVVAALPALITLLMHPAIQATWRQQNPAGSPLVRIDTSPGGDDGEPPMVGCLAYEAGPPSAAIIDFTEGRYIEQNVTAFYTATFSPQAVMECLPYLVALFTDPRAQAQLAADAARRPA